jgi:hypothetical protein
VSRWDLRRSQPSHLPLDACQQAPPGLIEGLGAIALELICQDLSVDPRLGELGQDFLGVATVSRHQLADLAVFGERLQRLGGDRVDGEGRRQGF